MRERSDPLVPLLAVAVVAFTVVAAGFVLAPRVLRWIGPRADAVVGVPLAPDSRVPVWLCRSVEGVALMLQGGHDGGTDAALDAALDGGPYHYLTLSVYNFDGPERYDLDLPAPGLSSPEGGANAVPAATVRRADAPDHLAAVLRGLGAVSSLSVEKGRAGHALFVLPADPARRTAFVAGSLRFERRELERRALASWRQRPDWKRFRELQ